VKVDGSKIFIEKEKHLKFQEKIREEYLKGWPGNRIKKWEIGSIPQQNFAFLPPLGEKGLRQSLAI
jgi:hypothetical protein